MTPEALELERASALAVLSSELGEEITDLVVGVGMLAAQARSSETSLQRSVLQRSVAALAGSAPPVRDRDAMRQRIARNVKRLREAKGLSQVECALRFGCSRAYWHQLENSGKVDASALLKAADVLGTTLEGLGVR